MIIGIVVVVVLILVVVAFVAVVMIHHSKKKREEQEREDKEIKKSKSRKDTVISKADMDKALESAMNLSPTGGDEPMALSNKDDVPT